MARKDDILKSFLEHEILRDKYKLTGESLPKTVSDALDSQVPIVNAIAKIIDGIESKPPLSDNVLRDLVTQYLKTSAL